MLRTPIAPTQPTTPTSGSRSACRSLATEVGVGDLGVLVDEHERLEVVALGDRVEDEVVGAKQRARGGVAHDLESGSAASADAALGAALVGVGLGDRRGEDDHRRRPVRAGAAARRAGRSAPPRRPGARAARRPRARARARAPSGRARRRRVRRAWRGCGSVTRSRRHRYRLRRSRAASARRSSRPPRSARRSPCSARNSSTARRQPVEGAVVVDDQVAADREAGVQAAQRQSRRLVGVGVEADDRPAALGQRGQRLLEEAGHERTPCS